LPAATTTFSLSRRSSWPSAVRRSPVRVQQSGSSPRGISASSELSQTPSAALPEHPLSRIPARSAPSLGFLPSSRHPRSASTHRGSSQDPLRSALRVSHPPDGFLRAAARGLVSCHSHVQGCTFRGFPPLRTTVLPLDSLDLLAFCSRRPSEQRAARASPTGRDLEAVLRPEMRPPAPGVIPRPVALPSWCSASPGLSLPPHPSPRFRDASCPALHRRPLHADFAGCASQVCSATGPVRLSRAARPS
jgi:hypothetical protein